jgi:hypothetical protein
MIEKPSLKKNLLKQYYSFREIKKITIKYFRTDMCIKIGDSKLII